MFREARGLSCPPHPGHVTKSRGAGEVKASWRRWPVNLTSVPGPQGPPGQASGGRGWHSSSASGPVRRLTRSLLRASLRSPRSRFQTFPANPSTEPPAECVGAGGAAPPPGISHPRECGPHGVDGTDRAVGSRRHELRARDGGWALPLAPPRPRRLGRGRAPTPRSLLGPRVQPVKEVRASEEPAERPSLTGACRGASLVPAAPR